MTSLGLGRISGGKPMCTDERAARELHPLAFKCERKPVNELDRMWIEVARREQAEAQEDARAFALPQSDPGDETPARSPEDHALAEAEAQFERAFGEPIAWNAEKNAAMREALDAVAAAPTPGLFARLTPEQQAKALAYDGSENHGSAEFRNPAPTPIYTDRKGYTTYTTYASTARPDGGYDDKTTVEDFIRANRVKPLTEHAEAMNQALYGDKNEHNSTAFAAFAPEGYRSEDEDDRIDLYDVVQLMIGGPIMIVTALDQEESFAECIWIDRNDHVNAAEFPIAILEHA